MLNTDRSTTSVLERSARALAAKGVLLDTSGHALPAFEGLLTLVVKRAAEAAG